MSKKRYILKLYFWCKLLLEKTDDKALNKKVIDDTSKNSSKTKKWAWFVVWFILTWVIYYIIINDCHSKIWMFITTIINSSISFISKLSIDHHNIFVWCISAILAMTICLIMYGIKLLVNKEKLNKERDISLATLWLLWGIFGTIFWDIIKELPKRDMSTWYYLIFWIFFWLLTVYLSEQIKTWSTTSQPTSPHDEENMTSSSQSSES